MMKLSLADRRFGRRNHGKGFVAVFLSNRKFEAKQIFLWILKSEERLCSWERGLGEPVGALNMFSILIQVVVMWCGHMRELMECDG